MAKGMQGAGVTMIDLVCGMKVASTSRYRHTFGGSDYVFCGPGCRDRFAADPAQFLGAAEGGYVCPTDPDVRSDKPGNCRKCGKPLRLSQPAHPSP